MVKPDSLVIAELLQEGLAAGELPFLTISSNSMLPLLRPGDQVGIEAVTHDDLVPGDIVVIRRKDALVTHRYWHATNSAAGMQMMTRGDRPLYFDPPAPPAALVGRVIVRRRRRRLLWLSHGFGGRLHRHLAAVARSESILFAGFSPQGDSAGQHSTYLGRHYRQNRRHLPSRFVRFTLYTWRRILVALAGTLPARGREPHPRLSTALLALLLLAALLLTIPYAAFASVDLSDFYARPGANNITLVWITANELDNLGFNLWRGTNCDPQLAIKLNDNLIASKAGGQATGASYEFVDDNVQPVVIYDYRIESVDSYGASECQQDFPVQASLGIGGAIGTPNAGDGTGVPVPTSTSAPTTTPAPSMTNAPYGEATDTPLPSRTSSPVPTATTAATSSDVDVFSTSLPSATPVVIGAGDDVPADRPSPSATSGQFVATSESTPRTAEVSALSSSSARALTPAWDPVDTIEPELVGSDRRPQAAEGASDTERSATTGGASRTLFIIVLTLGFFVLLGGIVTVVILVGRNRPRKHTE